MNSPNDSNITKNDVLPNFKIPSVFYPDQSGPFSSTAAASYI